LDYLSVTNAFTPLRLLPMSDRDKDVEILVPRHQITVLESQLGYPAVAASFGAARAGGWPWRRPTSDGPISSI